MRARAWCWSAVVIGAGAGAWAHGVPVLGARPAVAQTPQPVERVSFAEAVQRAISKNPSSAIAAAGILRADALLGEARSATRLQVNGSLTTTTLNTGVTFQDTTVTPRNSITAALDVRMPLYAPAAWARRVQAQDQRDVALLGVAEIKRQTALAAADAYLTIIARRRVVDAVVRASEVAQAHFELARELQDRGIGSRLNQLRAQQELSTDEGLVEAARFALYRAQEALGVLLVADGPVDANEEPTFEALGDSVGPEQALPLRTDLKLFTAERQAAERVFHDTSKDSFPSLQALFQPQSIYPAGFFSPPNSWRFLLQASVPIVDSGQRASQRLERQSALEISRARLAGAMTSATSEIRATREAVASAGRGLTSTRAAADQAQEVVNIVNVSFRAGAATNIEVIDAERRARDADTAVAVAEDALRRARLDLLNALGRFP